jgi:hypothetical protein
MKLKAKLSKRKTTIMMKTITEKCQTERRKNTGKDRGEGTLGTRY